MPGLQITPYNPLTYNNEASMQARGYRWDPRRSTWVNQMTGRTEAEERAGSMDAGGNLVVAGNPAPAAQEQDLRLADVNNRASMAQLEATLAAQREQATNEMERLRMTIAGQQGIATSAQAAEMARLERQLASEQGLLNTRISGDTAMARLQAELGNDTEERRYQRAREQQATFARQINDLLRQLGITSDGTSVARTATGAVTGSGATQDQEAAADAAAFAAAKDKIGLVNRAAQNDIGEQVVARGIGGSGIEAGMRVGAIERGRGELGQVVRDQATAQRSRAYQVADRDVNANLMRRGQDLGLTASMLNLLRASGTGTY